MDNNKGKYGLMGTVKALLAFRIMAVVASLASIGVMFLPWLTIKVKKYVLSYNMLNAMTLDSWYQTKYPKGYGKLISSANGSSYSLFMKLFMILFILYIAVIAVQFVASIVMFIVKKGLAPYKFYRLVSLAAIVISVLLLLFVLSLPGSKSTIFLDSMFGFGLAPFIMAGIQVLVYLLISKKIDEESQSLSFFFFEDIPSISQYKKILAEAGMEEDN